jgi:hypothetical protein
MSLHITRFLDKVRAAESRQQREVSLTLPEARDLHADITRLLLIMEQLREPLNQPTNSNEIQQIEVQGGSF